MGRQGDAPDGTPDTPVAAAVKKAPAKKSGGEVSRIPEYITKISS